MDGLNEINRLGQIALGYIVQYSFQAAGAVAILAIGWWVAGLIAGAARRLGERVGIDVTLTQFFAGAVKLAIIALVVIAALGNFGITIAPLIAAIGAAAFGATVAIQGPLSNFGAGIVIILTRPFKVGDTVTVKGVSGVVDVINLADTVLVNDGGDRIAVPNKQINGEIIVNSAEYAMQTTSLSFPMRYTAEAAIALVRETLLGVDGVARDRAPEVGIDAINPDGLTIGARYWVKNRTAHKTRYAVNRALVDLLERQDLRPKAG